MPMCVQANNTKSYVAVYVKHWIRNLKVSHELPACIEKLTKGSDCLAWKHHNKMRSKEQLQGQIIL